MLEVRSGNRMKILKMLQIRVCFGWLGSCASRYLWLCCLLFASPISVETWQGVEWTEPETTTGESWAKLKALEWHGVEIRNPYIGNHWLGIPIIIGLWHFKWAIIGFIGILILAYYNFLYNCVPLYAANQQGLGHCSSGFLPPAVSRYLGKTVTEEMFLQIRCFFHFYTCIDIISIISSNPFSKALSL